MIQVQAADSGKLEQAAKLLAGIDGGIQKALKSAATRSTSHLRTQSTKAIRERYAISQKNLRANENIRVSYTYQNGVTARVTFAGNKIPLYRYDGTRPSQPKYDTSQAIMVHTANGWKRVHPGIPAAAHQLKGGGVKTFNDAVVLRMKSGHVGIFERTGGTTSTGADQLRELMGSSVPQMLGNEKVQEDLAKSTMDKFDERLDHEVLAILNGWR